MLRRAANYLIPTLIVIALASPARADDFAFSDGDEKTACECILCLSTGKPPHECDDPLKEYFSIKKKKPEDTIEARRDFLNKCPSASQDDSMKSLVNAIAAGAGRCDADTLNTTLARTVTLAKVTTTQKVNGKWTYVTGYLPEGHYCPDGSGVGGCEMVEVTLIDNSKPSYCVAYANHAYTDKTSTVGATYVGDIYSGGHWE